MKKRSLKDIFTTEMYDKLARRGSMSLKIAASILGVHYMTVYLRLKRGQLKASRPVDSTKKHWTVRDEDLVVCFGGDKRLLIEARKRNQLIMKKNARKLFIKKGDFFNLGRNINAR